MDKRGAHQPRHEGGVFHGVPKPPTTPAQFVVRPPRPQTNTKGQKSPRDHGPRAGPASPCGVQSTGQHGGNGESKRDRHAHITHVEHGRVNHQARVLQQWVEVPSIGRHGKEPVKGVGSGQDEHQKTNRHQAQDPQHPRHHGQWQAGGKNRNRCGPATEHEHPQQQGALVAAPHRCELVGFGQQGVGMLGDVFHREVVA